MGIKSGSFLGAAIAATAILSPAIATAQSAPVGAEVVLIEVENIPDAFDDAYYGEAGTFFEATNVFSQTNNIIGAGVPASFPDLKIVRDANRIHDLHVELMDLQTSSDPIIRVPDLTNPFNSSVQLLPTASAGTRVVGSELLFERVPTR